MTTTTVHSDTVAYRFARPAGRSALRNVTAHVGRNWTALRVALKAAAAYDAAQTPASRRAALVEFRTQLGR
jgi:hypothetical protein